MFNRAILQQRQAVKAAFSPRTVSTVSFSSRRTSPYQLSSQVTRPFNSSLLRRYASAESQGENNEKDNTKDNGDNAKPQEQEEDPLKKELEGKNKEVVDLKVRIDLPESKLSSYILTLSKDKYLRSVAEFRNLQERTRRDIDNARTFAIQKFATDLVDSVDNFDRALNAVPVEKINPPEGEPNKDLVDLYSGLKMTENVLMNTLKKHGLVRFDPTEPVDGKAQKFDPNVHEATFMTPAQGKEDGDVLYTQSKGFLLNGRVLRVRIFANLNVLILL